MMKRTVRFPAFLVSILLLLALFSPGKVLAAEGAIDVSAAPDGFFTVAYPSAASVKMKVGVTLDEDTVCYDYVPGNASTYALTGGDGVYTIALYQNISGTSYKRVESVTVSVVLRDPLAPYLTSTEEISFSDGSAVSKTATRICTGRTDAAARVIAIHNYIADRYTYDSSLAARIADGTVQIYTPDTEHLITESSGICYDFAALFAAMCRSQDIPCALVKGELNGVSHAWNMVYVDGQWQAVDMTREIARKNTGATVLSQCLLTDDTGYVADKW